MKERKIPGIALLVVQDNKVVLSKGYGFSNVELQVPVKPETVFQSGSMGKQFTATAVMMLVEEGKVGLEDPLTKYFPEAPAAWKNVTVRQLLSHTGGFTDYPEKFDFRRDRTENEILKAIQAVPLGIPPEPNGPTATWDMRPSAFSFTEPAGNSMATSCRNACLGRSA